MASGVIDIEGVTIDRDDRRVLTDVSWQTKAGEHWVILGNNGSGKTTLLEIVMGYLWPQKGAVKVFGETFGDCFLPDIRKQIGFVAPWIFKRLGRNVPVKDIVASGKDAYIGFYERITPRLNAAIMRQLEDLGIADAHAKRFGRLSSGQQLKVVLARALVHQPRLLILDEPFSLLDIGARFGFYEEVEKIEKTRPELQVLLTTHHLEDIRKFFTHGLILKDGRIMIRGKIRDVIAKSVLAKAFNVPLRKLR